MVGKVLFLLFIYAVSSAAIYDCNQITPKASDFFDRKVVIECDLDFEANPKLVILSGSSKVPLNTKALYMGKDISKDYERLQITSHDGVTFGISVVGRMFIESPKGGFLTAEPNRKSAYWVCDIRD